MTFGALSLSLHCTTGAIYVLDLLMGFAMGFTVEHNLKRRVIMRPDLIARYYVLHNTFTTDFISAMAIIPEVSCCQAFEHDVQSAAWSSSDAAPI